ncbi:hypothetical protein JQC67_15760 [Aurantibacter crassamenti]|uniref:hypothetical protein n=1 Tax=Aurantibacter crassamenti TaxID=1837375 RepID=UPI00193A1173|nr:hypothetical protein [Aurantibacter crassamenti]MBM1107612.1 hypothetical protein [Aurantibacter crassamenti]
MNSLKNLTVIIFLLTTTAFYSQNKQDWDKIKSLKVAYFTEQLELTSNEAEAFWPVYNKYEKERYLLRKNGYDELRNRMKEADSFNEKEADKLLDEYLDYEENEEELDKNFFVKISKIITAKKTLKLIRAEQDFKHKLIRQYRKKHQDDKGNR